MDREFVIWVAGGCALWSWIVGCAGLQIRDMGCGLRVAVSIFGFSDGETEMRDKGERVR